MISFSVIIPNYNHALFLADRIESVLAQTYPDLEIIILDDCSTDHSRDIIEKYREHPLVTHIVYSTANSGSPFVQWKNGIELASHEWIWIAETDDLATPSFLEEAVKHINSAPNTGLYYCNSTIEIPGEPDTNTAAICNKLLPPGIWQNSYSVSGTDEINRALKYHSVILNVSATVFNKKNFSGWTSELEKFCYYGDWYTYIQAIAGASISYNHEIHNRFRRTPISHSNLMATKNAVQIKTECFRILNLLLQTSGVTEKKQLINWYIHKYVGFGIRSDGLRVLLKIIGNYFAINAWLATRILFRSLVFKISSTAKK